MYVEAKTWSTEPLFISVAAILYYSVFTLLFLDYRKAPQGV
jgi:hypothetical protein